MYYLGGKGGDEGMGRTWIRLPVRLFVGIAGAFLFVRSIQSVREGFAWDLRGF